MLRGSSVEVTGRRRSGRSVLVEEVARTLDGLGRPVVRVRGACGLPELEALRLTLVPRGPARDGGGRDVLAMHRALCGVVPGDACVVVDDADRLDESSRAVLGLLHATRGTVVVATCPERSPGPAGSWLADLLQPLVQVRLGPLTVEDLHLVLADRVAEQLAPAVSAQIHGQVAGLPGTAVAVLEDAIASGSLTLSDGLWVDAAPVRTTPAVAYDTHLTDLPTGARRGLEVLAHTGPVPRCAVEQLLRPGALRALEDRKVVRTVRAVPEDLVLVDPPGLADRLIGSSPPGCHADLHRVADRGSGGDPAADHTPDEGVLSARGPGDPWLTRALIARVVARRHRDGLRTAARRWEEDRSVARAADVLRLALSGPVDRHLVAVVLAETEPRSGAGTFDAVAVAYYRARLGQLGGRPTAAVVDELEHALPRGSPHHEALSTIGLLLRAEAEHADAATGSLLRSRVRGQDADSWTARVALAGWSLLRAEHAEALSVLGTARTHWPEPLRSTAELVVGLALFGLGRFADGLAHGRRLLHRATADGDGALWTAGSVVSALCSGALLEMDQARERLFALLASGASGHALLLRVDPVAGALLAAASLFTEEQHPIASSLLAAARRTHPGGAALPFADEAWPAALGHYAAGAAGACARVLDGVVAHRRALGHLFAAETTQMLRLALDYEPGRAAEFAGTAERIGGPLFPAYLSAKAAMQDEDPGRLLSVADRLHRLAAVRGSARCYADAAGLLRATGRDDEATRAWLAADALDSRAPVVRPAAHRRLSEREVQVVELVAYGMTNPMIADRLVVSIRTVESHLRNIKRKTGARDRAAIRSLVAD